MELPSLYVNPALKKAPATQLRRQKRHLLWPGTTEHSRKKLETPVIGETQKGNRNPNPNLKNIEFCSVGLFFFFSFFLFDVFESRVTGCSEFPILLHAGSRNNVILRFLFESLVQKASTKWKWILYLAASWRGVLPRSFVTFTLAPCYFINKN